MSWSQLTRCLLFAFAGAVFDARSAKSCGAEEPLPAPSEAQALADGLVDWKNSFHNLRLVSRWNNPGQSIQRRPVLVPPGLNLYS